MFRAADHGRTSELTKNNKIIQILTSYYCSAVNVVYTMLMVSVRIIVMGVVFMPFDASWWCFLFFCVVAVISARRNQRSDAPQLS